ncbi:MAG TPA: YdcF family protein [Synergistaceae bacterium]|nr:YdcF family protein [Synergistaceae bacterium]HPJ24877.1 YdcF family protein [Synergistaceae bacterium]HPQ37100.1 YdcF family protein [Synergistaceae bacterium]
MLYALYKSIGAFVLPPGICIFFLTLWGLSLLCKKPRRGGIGLGLLLFALLLYGGSTSLGPELLLAPLEEPYYSSELPEKGTDTGVVILGGGYWIGPEGKSMPGPYSTARLARGMEAARALNGWILCSGTALLSSQDREQTASLGESMSASLRSWGWHGKILFETTSRTTWENLRHLAPLLEQQGTERIILVTDAFHMRRSLAMAKRTLSCPVYPYPSSFLVDQKEHTWQDYLPSMLELQKSWIGLRERLGFLAYALYDTFQSLSAP